MKVLCMCDGQAVGPTSAIIGYRAAYVGLKKNPFKKIFGEKKLDWRVLKPTIQIIQQLYQTSSILQYSAPVWISDFSYLLPNCVWTQVPSKAAWESGFEEPPGAAAA